MHIDDEYRIDTQIRLLPELLETTKKYGRLWQAGKDSYREQVEAVDRAAKRLQRLLKELKKFEATITSKG